MAKTYEFDGVHPQMKQAAEWLRFVLCRFPPGQKQTRPGMRSAMEEICLLAIFGDTPPFV